MTGQGERKILRFYKVTSIFEQKQRSTRNAKKGFTVSATLILRIVRDTLRHAVGPAEPSICLLKQ